MSIPQYLKQNNINKTYTISEDNNYIITLDNSDDFGKMFSHLEKIEDLEQLEDNQVVTEQGTSILYKSNSENYLFNLIADFDGNVYELIVSEN